MLLKAIQIALRIVRAGQNSHRSVYWIGVDWFTRIWSWCENQKAIKSYIIILTYDHFAKIINQHKISAAPSLRLNRQSVSIALSLFFLLFVFFVFCFCLWSAGCSKRRRSEGERKGGSPRSSVYVEDPKVISLLWRKPTSRRLFYLLSPFQCTTNYWAKTKRASVLKLVLWKTSMMRGG